MRWLAEKALTLLIILCGGLILGIIGLGAIHIQTTQHSLVIKRIQVPLLLLALLILTRALFLEEGIARLKEKIRAHLNSDSLIWYILGTCAVLYSWTKISQYLSFNIHGVDFSAFDYAIWNTLHGRFMYTPFLDGNLFRYHFHPILLPVVPLYLAYDGPFTLLVLQALIIVAGGLPFYWLCRELFPERFVAPLLALAYLSYPKLLGGLFYDFHPVMALPCFILAAYYYLVKFDTPKYLLFIVLALMVKEDVAIYTFVLGAYVCIFERRWRLGSVTMGLSAVWFIATMAVIFTLNDGQPFYISRYSRYGGSLHEVAMGVLLHPLQLAGDLARVAPVKLLLHLLFLPILKPSLLLLAIPPYLVNATSSAELQANLRLFYGAPIVPFLFIAMVYGLKELSSRFAMNRQKVLWAACLLLVVINFGRYKTFEITEHHVIGYEVISRIPASASVSAQIDLIPHLPKRPEIYLLDRNTRDLDVEYVVFDKKGNKWPMSKSDYVSLFSSFADSTRHALTLEKDGYYVFRRVRPVATQRPREQIGGLRDLATVEE